MGHVSLTIHLWGDLSAVMHKDLYSMSKVADFKVIGKRSTEKKRPQKKGPSENEESGKNVHTRAES